jgi:hypothetical protein
MKGHDSYSLVLSELTAEAEHSARSIRSGRRRLRDGADARRDPGPRIEELRLDLNLRPLALSPLREND